MSEEQTAEQRKAAEALEAAIRDYIAAYSDSGGLLMEWVLVTAEHYAEGDAGATAVGHWCPVNQPLYRTLGLLDYATSRNRAYAANNADTGGPA